jgi:dTDP-4-amino-4,6-dideoxygalactose transaminase
MSVNDGESAGGRALREIPFARAEVCQQAVDAAVRVLESGWLTSGPEVVAFERELAHYLDAQHAVAVASCTAAIELALRALQLPPQSRVLTSTMTFCGAINAIIHAGHLPVLADINPDTLCMDPDTCATATKRAGGVQAMVVTHYAGYPIPIGELAEATSLPLTRVIEDAAHALGATTDGTLPVGTPVGTLSAAACFSFYATKNLPIGEGGMVTTNDPTIADYIRRARLHGMSRDAWKRYLPGNSWQYTVNIPGLKANMTDLQATIGRAQLHRFPAWQARRALLANHYDEALDGIKGLRLPARPDKGEHAWHLYVLQVQPKFGTSRDQLLAHLAEHGIHCSVHFIPAHHFPYYQHLLDPQHLGHHPNADAAYQQILSLPLYPSLALPDIDYISEWIGSQHSVGAVLR